MVERAGKDTAARFDQPDEGQGILKDTVDGATYKNHSDREDREDREPSKDAAACLDSLTGKQALINETDTGSRNTWFASWPQQVWS